MALEKDPLAVDDFEKNALEVFEDIAAHRQFRDVPQQDGRLPRFLSQSMGAKHVAELDTSTG